MKLMLGLLSVALGFSSTAQAGTYTCEFETNQVGVKQCNIDSASPTTSTCSFPFPGTDFTGICVVVPQGADDLLSCVITSMAAAAAPALASVVQSKSVAAALTALPQVPGFTAASATLAPTSKATIHLGYKQGQMLYSAICPPKFEK